MRGVGSRMKASGYSDGRRGQRFTSILERCHLWIKSPVFAAPQARVFRCVAWMPYRRDKTPVFAPVQARASLVWKNDALFAKYGVKGRQSLVGRGVTPHNTVRMREPYGDEKSSGG